MAWIGAGTLLALAALGPSGVSGAPNSGSIWTTSGDCSTPNAQDKNQYAIGEPVVIRGSNFDPDTQYSYEIKGQPGNASNDPNIVVASGNVTSDGTGYFCVLAYTVQADDGGQYKVEAGGKQDAYGVVEASANPTPTPTPSPTPTPDGSASPSPSGDAISESDDPSLPPTDRSSGSGGTTDSLGLVLMALAGVLASIMVVTPARARRH